MVIKFYSTSGKYGCFSNFSNHSVNYGGYIYPTSEHAFQARKFFNHLEIHQRILEAPTPKAAAQIGRSKNLPFKKEDWDQVKDHVMSMIVYCKFLNPEIRDVLLSTGEEEIQENSPIDYYWGIGSDGSGQNKLGKILMEVRSSLRRNLEEIERSKQFIK